jgi:hypothetical protein
MAGSERRAAWHHRGQMEDEPIALAGSDAERRAHLRLAARLRDGGRDATVETQWVRPRWELAHALHAGLGVAASVVAVSAPAVGLGLAAVALLSLLLDLSGRLFLLRRLTPERATENVVALAPGRAAEPRVRLLLTAHCDAPRGGLLHRLARGRSGAPAGGATGEPRAGGESGIRAGSDRRARGTDLAGRLPGPFAWIALSLLAVAVCAGLRLGTDDAGTAIGAVQLVPTLLLLVALGLLVDAALSAPVPADPRAADAVLAAARALDAVALRSVAVDIVIAGAGEAQAAGFLAFLRRHRPSRETTVVVELTAADGPPRWLTTDGGLLPLRYHPRLVGLAAQTAAEERTLDARAARGHAVGAALRARQRRLPAIRLTAADTPTAVALLLTLAETLDDDLARG